MMSFYLKALFFAIVVLSMVLTIPSVLADNWYVGKGLKQGDYFRYNVCHIDYHNCAPLEIDFWVQNQTSDGNWNLQFLAIDAKEIQRGTVTIGGILFYPLNYSSNLSNYVNVYNNTIGWINQFSNKAQPKSFGDLEWGSSGFTCGQSVGPIGQANVTVQAGTFNAWTIRWTVGADSMIWVAPNLPFPVKGLVYYSCHLGSPYPVHVSDYELLQTGNSQTLPPQLDFTSVWSHPQSIMPPRQQIVNGVSPDKVVCSQGFVLIMKTSVNSAACVKPQTAQKLVERGWGTIIAGSILLKIIHQLL